MKLNKKIDRNKILEQIQTRLSFVVTNGEIRDGWSSYYFTHLSAPVIRELFFMNLKIDS